MKILDLLHLLQHPGAYIILFKFFHSVFVSIYELFIILEWGCVQPNESCYPG